MTNALQDIRIGTMVKGNLPDPAAYVRQILPLGFESIQPFFWQTLGGKDLRSWPAEIREAIGNADVVSLASACSAIRSRTATLDRETLQGWKDCIDNAHHFGADLRRRLHRPRPRQAADRQPAALQGGLGRARQARRRQGREDRLRELRHGRQLGDRRLEHRPQSRCLGADVQRSCPTTISGSNGSPATSWST